MTDSWISLCHFCTEEENRNRAKFLRYGLQLCGKVRTLETDPTQSHLKELQKAQNKLLRLLNNTRLKDMVRTKSIAQELKMLSVNQINAQVKLTEMWKMQNVDNYPIQCEKQVVNNEQCTTRAVSRGDLVLKGQTLINQSTFINDASRHWNNAPNSIKRCNSLFSVKSEIKKHVMTLPL